MTITRDQFRLQMDRLIDTFGERHFAEQREMMIWDTVEGEDYDLVIHLVDGFIRKSKNPPLPSDFSEALSLESRGRKKWALGEIQPKEIAKCWDCGDSGFIRLERNETFESWAKCWSGSAPCHCQRGKLLIEAGKRHRPEPWDFGPQFNDDWKRNYSVSPAWVSGDGIMTKPEPA